MKRVRIQTASAGQIVGQPMNRMIVTQPNIGMVQRQPGNIQPPQVRPTGMRQVQQPTASAPQQEQIEPIVKAKELLPQLKVSLVSLMQVASQNVAVSIDVDDMQKGVDSSNIPPFNKCLEHFYSLCDQLECQLNLAYQQISQALASTQHAPLMMTANIRTDPKGPQVYGNYVNTVEHQLHYAKEIHDLLSNCCKKLTEHQTNLPTL